MLGIFREEKIVTAFILIFFMISMLLQITLCRIYDRMIKETDNMATTDNKLLKQCKLKFSNCYQLNNGVPNIPVFVDKFLSRLALGHISFDTLYHLSGQALLMSVVGAGVGVCRSIAKGRMLVDILPFYIVSLLELYLYFSLSAVMDVKGRKNILKINLVDYLENHLSARIGDTQVNLDMLYGTAASGKSTKRGGKRTIEFTPITNRIPELHQSYENTENVAQEQNTAFGGEQQKELEALLIDFLSS
jgi:hypothetical protein